MAFNFGSDILVDAMRAADPAKLAQSKLRLEQLSKAAKSGSTAPFKAAAGVNFGRTEKPVDVREETLRKFEAVVLTTFVQAMMPKDSAAIYGEGLAGDMWKSQMAEKIAEQLSKSGGIGIADRLLKDYQLNNDKAQPLSGISDATRAVSASRGIDAASSFVQSLQTDLLGTQDNKVSNPVTAPSTAVGN